MKNYFLLYHNEPKKGVEGTSFYYSNVQKNLHLRYARFQKGDVSALVSSKHSQKKLKALLGKPKDLWIFHCCGFKILDSYFNCWEINTDKGSHYQWSHDGKDWENYHLGTDRKIDSLFNEHKQKSQQHELWINKK